MPSIGPLDQQLLRKLIHYDPATGVITRLYGKTAGQPVTSTTHGYVQVWLQLAPGLRKKYYGHQLAWLYMYGYMPERVDHKDTYGTHNWIDNLREATKSQNAANRYCLNANNTSGYRGVVRNHTTGPNTRWVAQIMFEGKYRHLGTYDTAEKASAVYEAKAKELFGAFA